jgi:Flp pilus assembly protein TadG
MRPTSSRPPKRRGASLVEFAFVAPVFFGMIIGIVEVGRGLMVQQLLTEAARRGARAGVIEGTSSAQIKSAVTDYLTTVGVNGSTAGISVNDAPVDTVEAQNMPAYTEMTVSVSVPVSSCTWLPASWFLSGNVSGQFTMRRE